MSSVEIISIVRNEEVFLEFFYDFYRERFSDVTFSLVDMGSTDGTIELAKKLGMNLELRHEEFFSDMTNVELKNTLWQSSKKEYVIIQDLDELLDVDDDFLKNNEFSMIKAEAWDMVGEGQAIKDITKAVRLPEYDKCMMFKVKHFSQLSFSAGAHYLHWKSNIKGVQILRRPMYHYNRLSLEYVIEKYKSRQARMSKENIEKNWGFQYQLSEKAIREEYTQTINNSIHIFPKGREVNVPHS